MARKARLRNGTGEGMVRTEVTIARTETSCKAVTGSKAVTSCKAVL